MSFLSSASRHAGSPPPEQQRSNRSQQHTHNIKLQVNGTISGNDAANRRSNNTTKDNGKLTPQCTLQSRATRCRRDADVSYVRTSQRVCERTRRVNCPTGTVARASLPACRLPPATRDATRSARVDLSNAAPRRAQLRASSSTNQHALRPPIFAVTF